MKQRSKNANIVTAVLAILLSVILVPTLFAAGLVNAANSATTPGVMSDLITNMVQDIDFEQIIIDSAQDNDISEEALAQARTVTALLDSKAAKEFFTLYAKDVTAALSGTYDPANAAVSAQALTDIANDHVDELVDVLVALEPDADREEIRTSMLTYVQENAADILSSIAIDKLVDMDGLSEIASTLNVLKVVSLVLLGVCLVLGGLIYACRYYRFGGFIWLGVDTGIVALLTLGTALAVKNPMVAATLGAEGETAMLLTGMLNAVGGVLLTVALILFGVTALFIGLFILLKYKVLNKREAGDETAEEIAAETAEQPALEEQPVAEEETL